MNNTQAIRLLLNIIESKYHIDDPDEQYVCLRIFAQPGTGSGMICRVCFYDHGDDKTINEFMFFSFTELEEKLREVTRR
jgi:hypothetical protein